MVLEEFKTYNVDTMSIGQGQRNNCRNFSSLKAH